MGDRHYNYLLGGRPSPLPPTNFPAPIFLCRIDGLFTICFQGSEHTCWLLLSTHPRHMVARDREKAWKLPANSTFISAITLSHLMQLAGSIITICASLPGGLDLDPKKLTEMIIEYWFACLRNLFSTRQMSVRDYPMASARKKHLLCTV